MKIVDFASFWNNFIPPYSCFVTLYCFYVLFVLLLCNFVLFLQLKVSFKITLSSQVTLWPGSGGTGC